MTPAPITFADLPPDWPGIVREIIVREGCAVRGNPLRPVIEVKSLTTNLWHRLMLPSGAHEFATFEDRNIVLRKLEGKQ